MCSSSKFGQTPEKSASLTGQNYEKKAHAGQYHEYPHTLSGGCVVLFVDGRSLTRDLVEDLIESCTRTLVVVPYFEAVKGEASSPDIKRPALLLLHGDQDSLLGDDVKKMITIMRRHGTDKRVVILCESVRPEQVYEAFSQGTWEYIDTLESPIGSIDMLELPDADTGIPESAVAERLGGGDSVEDIGSQSTHFTPREMEVLELLRDGKSNKAIARDLNVQAGTVKAHLQNIMTKLMVNNRTVAAVRAAQILERGERAHNDPRTSREKERGR